jgi:hypothetical protein
MVVEKSESMRQYETWIDDVLRHKPKHSRPYGVKLPDARELVVVAVAALVILLAVARMV